MATALNYGFPIDHEHCGHMHASVDMEPSTELQSPIQDGQLSPLGLDGSNDHSSTHDKTHGLQHDAHDFFRQRKKTTIPVPDACSIGPDSGGCRATDVDPNLARRKRRKITPSNQTSLKTFIGAKLEDNSHKTQNDPSTTLQPADKPLHKISGTDQALPTPQDKQHSQKDDSHIREAISTVSSEQTALEQQIEDSSARSKRTPKKSAPSCSQTDSSSPSRSKSSRSTRTTQKGISSKQAACGKNMKMRNGRFVHSYEIILRYGHDQASRQAIGARIAGVLSSTQHNMQTAKPHPFFLSKSTARAAHPSSDTTSDPSTVAAIERTGEQALVTKAPVAWGDIKFSNTKGTMFKSVDSIHAIWPPTGLQHIGRTCPSNMHAEDEEHGTKQMKLKTKVIRIDNMEDVLQAFAKSLSKETVFSDIQTPQRRLLSGSELVSTVMPEQSAQSSSTLLKNLYSTIEHGMSPFDKGEHSGQQIWNIKYAPVNSQDVLQPSCHILRDWLKTLAVHNVKSGGVQGDKRENEKLLRKKRRQKKVADELDDFIVDDDNDMSSTSSIKNAVLITGPHGCGKTASVYAVAKEMDFEVFEIHPGMRRSAKDIFDRVGDMTQNHLVQQKDDASRSSSIGPMEPDTDVPVAEDKSQPSLTSFLGSKKVSKNKTLATTITEAAPNKKEQKQSLILFEEVDILFESDKAFWTGVQNLIHQSRRPVVLTCNDVSQIPISDLDLYTILEYEAPDTTIVTEYLTALCASEGHIVNHQAVSNLYMSKGHDLRASITELSFWCQMTVGSQKGGLDWLFASAPKESRLNKDGEKLRICSEGTYHLGLDILPESGLGMEHTIQQCQESLQLHVSPWLETSLKRESIELDGQPGSLSQLDQILGYDEAQSVLDILDDKVAAIIATAINTQYSGADFNSMREHVTSMCMIRLNQRTTVRPVDFVDAFAAMTIEKPTFPSSQGRLAPSIDSYNTAVAVDVAPYVRSIVAFDQQLEKQREELFGSQGKKSRNTRAARAAAEGGDKAHTRAERWFPRHLDFDSVLETGNAWPQWLPDTNLNDGHEFDTEMDEAGV